MSQEQLQITLDKYVDQMNMTLKRVFHSFKQFNIPCNWEQFTVGEGEVGIFKWVWKYDHLEFILEVQLFDFAYVFVNEGAKQREILEEAPLEKAIRRLRCFMDDNGIE